MTDNSERSQTPLASKDESPVVFNLRQIAASDIARWDIRNHIAAAADEIERLERELKNEMDMAEINIGRQHDRGMEYMRERDRLKAALLELVACKALREKIDGELSACHQEMSPQLQALENEYQLRKPLAWRDARAALSGEPTSASETFGVWQPIETAPKSKSDAGRDRHYVLVVYPGYKGDEPDPFVLMAYQDSLGWDTGVWRLHATPTHWMPLPSLPGTAPTVTDGGPAEAGHSSENGSGDSA